MKPKLGSECCRLFGHERRDHAADSAKRLGDDGDDACELLRTRFFAKPPRLGLIDVPVGLGDGFPDRIERTVGDARVEEFGSLRRRLIDLFSEPELKRAGSFERRYRALEMLFHKGKDAVQKISEAVGELAIVPGDEILMAEIPVVAETDLSHQIIAEHVDADALRERHGRDEVAEGLRHLLAVDGEPSVRADLRRELEPRAHQKGGPINRMEAKDVLADDVYDLSLTLGPKPIVERGLAGLGGASKCGDVVREGVEPDIHHVLGIVRKGDAPIKAGSRDG